MVEEDEEGNKTFVEVLAEEDEKGSMVAEDGEDFLSFTMEEEEEEDEGALVEDDNDFLSFVWLLRLPTEAF